MKQNIFYQFSSPSNLTMVSLMIIPLGVAVFLSFHFVTFFNINSPDYVGFENYLTILRDPQFWQAFRFSILTIVVVVPVQIVLGFFIATRLDKISTGLRGVFITLILLPFIVVPVVGTLMFRQLFEVGGLVSYVYRAVFDKPFLINAVTVRILVLVHMIWYVTPYPVIVFFAGLQGLPGVQIEAAKMDGASAWQRLIHIVIPYLKPLLLMTSMILVMDTYRMFDSLMVMTRMNPMFQAENMMVYSYRVGMGMQRLGMANATAVLTVLGVMVVLAPFLRMTYRNQLGKD